MRNPTAFLSEEYLALVKANLNWRLRELQGPSSPISKVDGKKVIMLCSNNYLGLTNHPKIKQAATNAIKTHGVGSGSVRAITRLAKFKKVEASLMYISGFAANAGLIPQLAPDKKDAIVSDELNHGSIIDGVRLSKAKRFVYRHTDVADLERALTDAEKTNPRRILVITDGVFSMDGDIAPLDQIQQTSEPFGAMVYVDDAHGEGVLGDGGRGIVNHFKLEEKVHVEMGTFSKAFGVVGGHISGSRDLVNFAFNTNRTWLLSASAPPAAAAACTAAIDVLETEPDHVKRLWERTSHFRKSMKEFGFNTGNSATPIIPIIVGASKIAKKMSDRLYEEGVFALPIVYPMVAKDQARIRTIMNAALSQEELDQAITVFEKIGKELHII
ncbi:MAG: aminotransferase class I/II-fold pyridoxal phosphate-dependent enzyme [Candidatus Ranarchaeia archaeon]